MAHIFIEMLGAALPILASRTTHPFDWCITPSFFVHVIEICLLANGAARGSHYHTFRKLPCDLGDVPRKRIRIVRGTAGDHNLEPPEFIPQIVLPPRHRQIGGRIRHPLGSLVEDAQYFANRLMLPPVGLLAGFAAVLHAPARGALHEARIRPAAPHACDPAVGLPRGKQRLYDLLSIHLRLSSFPVPVPPNPNILLPIFPWGH